MKEANEDRQGFQPEPWMHNLKEQYSQRTDQDRGGPIQIDTVCVVFTHNDLPEAIPPKRTFRVGIPIYENSNMEAVARLIEGLPQKASAFNALADLHEGNFNRRKRGLPEDPSMQ